MLWDLWSTPGALGPDTAAPPVGAACSALAEPLSGGFSRARTAGSRPALAPASAASGVCWLRLNRMASSSW
eukprot:15446724-Alexandrium_andersonii.AAC.1